MLANVNLARIPSTWLRIERNRRGNLNPYSALWSAQRPRIVCNSPRQAGGRGARSDGTLRSSGRFADVARQTLSYWRQRASSASVLGRHVWTKRVSMPPFCGNIC